MMLTRIFKHFRWLNILEYFLWRTHLRKDGRRNHSITRRRTQIGARDEVREELDQDEQLRNNQERKSLRSHLEKAEVTGRKCSRHFSEGKCSLHGFSRSHGLLPFLLPSFVPSFYPFQICFYEIELISGTCLNALLVYVFPWII